MNESKFYSFLGLIQKSGKLISGYTKCIFEIKKDKCKLIIVAQDSSSNTKDKFKGICKVKGIPCIIFGDTEKLSRSIGKSSISIIGIKDENMSKVVLDMAKES